MTASDLNQWIALFMMDLAPDGQGGYRETVPPGLTPDIPAAVRTPTPRIVFSSDQLADRVQWVITIRFQPGYTTDWRVLWKDSYLNIVGLKNIGERDTFLELLCERNEAGAQ